MDGTGSPVSVWGTAPWSMRQASPRRAWAAPSRRVPDPGADRIIPRGWWGRVGHGATASRSPGDDERPPMPPMHGRPQGPGPMGYRLCPSIQYPPRPDAPSYTGGGRHRPVGASGPTSVHGDRPHRGPPSGSLRGEGQPAKRDCTREPVNLGRSGLSQDFALLMSA